MTKKKKKDGLLASCAKRSVERYFKDLNGAETTDLFEMVMSEVERPLLEAVMRHTESNQCKAAEILGINRNTLRKKLKNHGLAK